MYSDNADSDFNPRYSNSTGLKALQPNYGSFRPTVESEIDVSDSETTRGKRKRGSDEQRAPKTRREPKGYREDRQSNAKDRRVRDPPTSAR